MNQHPVQAGCGTGLTKVSAVSVEAPAKKCLAKRLSSLRERSTKNDHSGLHPDYATAILEDAIEARASDIHLEPIGQTMQDAMLKLRAGITTLAEVKRASSGAFSTNISVDPGS